MKKMKSMLGFAFALVLILAMFTIPATKNKAHAEDKEAKLVNVVFVIDESGSMLNNDKEKLRYQAVNLFLQHMRDEGNRVGMVTFSHEIMVTPMQDISGVKAKDLFVRNSRPAKDPNANDGTDIGGAIDEATDMLVNERNSKIDDSVIILLTDGVTSLSGKDSASGKTKVEISGERKEEAIKRAKDKGIKIYSVCLNTGSEPAAYSEVKAISDATNGKSVEIKRAGDFQNAFLEMLGDILGIDIPDPKVITHLPYEEQFVVPIGVKELNITINYDDPITLELIDADGNSVNLKDSLLITDWYQFVKLIDPICGEWTIKIDGSENAKVDLRLIYDNDVNIMLFDRSTGPVEYNKPVPVEVQVTNAGNYVNDPNAFKRLPVVLRVTTVATGDYEDIVIPDGKLTYDLKFTEMGKYEVMALIDDGNYILASQKLEFELANNGPSGSGFVIEKNIFPWTADEVIDLGQYVSDPEGLPLTIKISGSDLADGTYELNGNELTVAISKSGSGKITFTVTDAQGDSSNFAGEFILRDLFKIIVIIVVSLIALAIIITVIYIISDKNKPLKGSIKVVTTGRGGTSRPSSYEGGKGYIKMLYAFPSVGDAGDLVAAKCQFHAGGDKSYIYFICSDGFYSDSSPSKKIKKIKIMDGMETVVYGQEDGKEQLKITYTSFDSQFGIGGGVGGGSLY